MPFLVGGPGAAAAANTLASVIEEAWSSDDRRALARAARAVSGFLDSWDPIGVYRDDDGPPPGEYDDLTWPLVRLLVDEASEEELAARLRDLVAERYGLPAPDAEAVARTLRNWWQARCG